MAPPFDSPLRRSIWKPSWQRKFLMYVLLMQVSVLLIVKTKAPLARISRFGSTSDYPSLNHYLHHGLGGSLTASNVDLKSERGPSWLPLNDVSRRLEAVNQKPARNADLFPDVVLRADESIVVVLYVHNRPQYLRLVVEALSHVEGLNETLLIVSHDGSYEEMNAIVEGITFCRVKQIFAPYSPHMHPDSFPGLSPGDCQAKKGVEEKADMLHSCVGDPDQFGNYRSPRIVSLKHHWWWMMNTVWDSLPETRSFNGHIAFIEEDHYLFPNAYRSLQALVRVKRERCPMCWAAMLAPFDVNSRGEYGFQQLIMETMGNIGYTFNRTVWEEIKSFAPAFCRFDDYNWDITMRTVVFEKVPSHALALRGPLRSAAHFGRCGLHEGKARRNCQEVLAANIPVRRPADNHVNFDEAWHIHRRVSRKFKRNANFTGWGGWGDKRDHRLCLHFAGIEMDDDLQAVAPTSLPEKQQEGDSL